MTGIEIYQDKTIHKFDLREFDEFQFLLKNYDYLEDIENLQRFYLYTDYYKIGNYFNINWYKDAIRSMYIENAGGKSVLSEALSMQYFNQILKANNFILEMEIDYWVKWKMIDYICEINNKRIGVSVTRAMGYPDESSFTEEDAKYLLNKKINGLVLSRNCITKKHCFNKSVLHVWCQSSRIAKILKKIFMLSNNYDLPEDSLIILLTISENDFIYSDKIIM